MPSLGKSINLYLMDGSEAGRWQASLSNWNGVGYKIPHGDLKNCSDLPELNTPGVYFLFGKDDETGKQFIYVGEADDVQKRLMQPHTFEKDGSYWTEAVIFVTPDGTLEKGRVKYLENRFYTIAVDAKRYIVKNGNTPTQSPLPKSVRDLLEEFVIDVELVLPALGYMAFVPLPSSSKDDKTDSDDLLYFNRNKGKGGNAVGIVRSDGFWVLKGSFINPTLASYAPAGIKALRSKYAGVIDSKGYLAEDICFGSPSYASTFVCGKNSNGLVEWKDKNGVSLKDLDTSTATTTTAKTVKTTDTEPKKAKMKAPATCTTEATNEDILHLSGKKAVATGKIVENGFVVLKGSEFFPTETKSCQSWLRNTRKQLLDEGKVQNGIFVEDVTFPSASSAAGCVIGGSANGNTMWLYPDGESIKDKSGK